MRNPTVTIDTAQMKDTFFPVRFRLPNSKPHAYQGIGYGTTRTSDGEKTLFHHPLSSCIHNGPRTAHPVTIELQEGDVVAVTIDSAGTERGKLPAEKWYVLRTDCTLWRNSDWNPGVRWELVESFPAESSRRRDSRTPATV